MAGVEHTRQAQFAFRSPLRRGRDLERKSSYKSFAQVLVPSRRVTYFPKIDLPKPQKLRKWQHRRVRHVAIPGPHPPTGIEQLRVWFDKMARSANRFRPTGTLRYYLPDGADCLARRYVVENTCLTSQYDLPGTVASALQ